MTHNYQAMDILCCTLDAIEYTCVSGCETANAIWKLLEITHEGTNQLKESKMGALVRDYELFLKQNESITNMFTCFTNIINDFRAYGKTYFFG